MGAGGGREGRREGGNHMRRSDLQKKQKMHLEITYH